MKKSFLKSLTFALVLLLVMTILALPSCKCHEHCSTVVQNGSELFNVVRSVDTVVVRDSVFVREVMKGDTVYLTRVEWRDRWRTHLVHDTIVRTDSIVQVIEHPPERYVPKFYKRCTIILFIILAASIVYLIFRWRLRL